MIGALFVLAVATDSARATIIINAPEPAPQYDNTATDFDVYVAGNAAGSPSAGTIDTNRGYRFLQTTSLAGDTAANWVWVDIQNTQPPQAGVGQVIAVGLSIGDTHLRIRAAGAKNGTAAPGVCGSGGTCQPAFATDGFFYSAIFTPNSTLRVAFSIPDLCATSGVTGTLCTGARFNTLANTMATQAIRINFGVLNTNDARLTLSGGTGITNQSFDLFVSDLPPQSSCAPASDSQFYFPGDQQILLNLSGISFNANSGPPVQNAVVLAKLGSTPASPPSGLVSGNDVVEYVSANSSVGVVNGFQNSNSASDTPYTLKVYAQNRAGIISEDSNTCSPAIDVRAQPISGILNESKCFIATAAYQSGTAAPVMLLRKFRDRVLAQHAWGRSFIESYYQHSPEWAEWAWSRPWARALARKLLTPLELFAWVAVQIADAQTPGYIEKVKTQLKKKSDHSEGYSESLKRQLEAEEGGPRATENDSYSEQQKKSLEQDASEPQTDPKAHQQYTEKLKQELPPEKATSNPSELIKKGLDRKLGRGDVEPIKNAVNFRMGVSPGMQVTVVGGTNTFSDIYGGGWQPELMFHYERQLFHSENLGSIGLTGDFGLSYAEGFGRLRFAFDGTQVSRTKMSFIQVPILVGANYRFNLFRLLRPYAGAGVGTMLYTEIRSDQQPDRRGYSFVYDLHGGASLLLDFLDHETTQDSYLSEGIQHTYLFAEYFLLNTLSGNVQFARSGIYSGFLFEF